jgi:hypothetical protein
VITHFVRRGSARVCVERPPVFYDELLQRLAVRIDGTVTLWPAHIAINQEPTTAKDVAYASCHQTIGVFDA